MILLRQSGRLVSISGQMVRYIFPVFMFSYKKIATFDPSFSSTAWLTQKISCAIVNKVKM